MFGKLFIQIMSFKSARFNRQNVPKNVIAEWSFWCVVGVHFGVQVVLGMCEPTGELILIAEKASKINDLRTFWKNIEPTNEPPDELPIEPPNGLPVEPPLELPGGPQNKNVRI